MKVKVSQSCPTLCNPMDYADHEILQARILEWVAVPSSRGSSQPGIEPRSHALQAVSLPAEPPGKPRDTGVGSLSLLQRIFPNLGIKPGSPALQVDSLPTDDGWFLLWIMKPSPPKDWISPATFILLVSGECHPPYFDRWNSELGKTRLFLACKLYFVYHHPDS